MSKSTQDWIHELGSDDSKIRKQAARYLSIMGEEAIAPLIDALRWENAPLDAVTQVLQAIGSPAISPLTDLLNEGDDDSQAKAALALAQMGDNRAVMPLIMALGDDSVAVRAAAAQALGAFDDPRATTPLLQALEDEAPQLRAAAAQALGTYPNDQRVLPRLMDTLQDPDAQVRGGVIRALAKIPEEQAEQALNQATQDADGEVRQLAAAALRYRQGDQMAFLRLEKNDDMLHFQRSLEDIKRDGAFDESDLNTMRHSNPRVRAELLQYIGKDGEVTEEGVRLAIPALSDVNPAVRATAVQTLVNMNKVAVKPLLEALSNKSRYVRAGVIEVLSQRDEEQALPDIAARLHDRDEHPMVRLAAVEALARCEGDETDEWLLSVARDGDNKIREAAVKALTERGIDPEKHKNSPLERLRRLFRR